MESSLRPGIVASARDDAFGIECPLDLAAQRTQRQKPDELNATMIDTLTSKFKSDPG